MVSQTKNNKRNQIKIHQKNFPKFWYLRETIFLNRLKLYAKLQTSPLRRKYWKSKTFFNESLYIHFFIKWRNIIGSFFLNLIFWKKYSNYSFPQYLFRLIRILITISKGYKLNFDSSVTENKFPMAREDWKYLTLKKNQKDIPLDLVFLKEFEQPKSLEKRRSIAMLPWNFERYQKFKINHQ